jgi:hypothetical protein
MGVGAQRHAPAALSPGKISVTHCTGGWVDPSAVWTGAENLVPNGIRSTDPPVRSESDLYLLFGMIFHKTEISHGDVTVQTLGSLVAGVHKYQMPDHSSDYILYDGIRYLSVLSMEPASCRTSGAQNFEVASRILVTFMDPLLWTSC